MASATEAVKKRMADEGHTVALGQLVIEVSTQCATLPADIAAAKEIVPATTKLYNSFMQINANGSEHFKVEMQAEFDKPRIALDGLRAWLERLLWNNNAALVQDVCLKFNEAWTVVDDDCNAEDMFDEICVEALHQFEWPKALQNKKWYLELAIALVT